MLFFLSMFATLDGHTQVRGGELGGLTTIQEGVRNRRISSADKTGNNNGVLIFRVLVLLTIFGLLLPRCIL